jgi:hypothetical protein
VEGRHSNLLLDIFNIYTELKAKYKVPWRFRVYDDNVYWANVSYE